MYYQTKPRQAIEKYLKSKKDIPFTAEDIIEYFDSAISTATIYRTLDQLVLSNQISKYFLNPPTVAYYQNLDENLKCEEHFHLVCINCGRLFHTDCIIYQDLTSHLLDHHNFKMDEKETVIYGWCELCQNKGNEKK